MGAFGGYYKGEKRKKKKEALEREAKHIERVYTPPQVEIVKKGK